MNDQAVDRAVAAADPRHDLEGEPPAHPAAAPAPGGLRDRLPPRPGAHGPPRHGARASAAPPAHVRALAEAAAEVPDWSGGTRIGASLATFNRKWSRRVLRRGAIVVIVSDGLDREAKGVLERQMRYLRHRCYRLVWLNPYLGTDGYEPRAAGMAAALPFVDDFLPIHDLQSLHEFSRALASMPVTGRSVRSHGRHA